MLRHRDTKHNNNFDVNFIKLCYKINCMPKIEYVKYTLVFLIILISIVISRNLIVTGNITGEQTIYKMGILKVTDKIFLERNDRIEYGTNLALSPSLFESFRIENIIRDNSNFNSSFEDFRNSDAKAIFAVNVRDAFKVFEMGNYEMLIFSLSSSFSFSEPRDSLFFLRDFFLIPVLIMADSMRDYEVKKLGIVYVKSPIKRSDIFDYSDEIYNSIFNKIVGEIVFTSTFYVENKSNPAEIINLINSTEPEAIAFLGYGTFYEEFSELLSEIKSNTTGDMKIYSIGWGSKDRVYDFSETFHDVFIIETDYFPEKFWRGILQNPTGYQGGVTHLENPENIHLDLGNEIILPEGFGDIDFYPRTGRSYPYTVEGYIFVEILKNLIEICGDDITCMKEKIHENKFDTVIGKVKFRKNGVVIRPYLLKKINKDLEGFITLKRYTLNDIEKIISDYNLDFLN